MNNHLIRNMKGNTSIQVNHEVLTWARESMALSRSKTSEKTGISSKRLIQLETGEIKPTLEEIKLLSKAYKRTIATLLLNQPPKEKPLPTDRRTLDSKDIGLFHEKTIMAVRKARALAQSYAELREEMNMPFPKLSLSASLNDHPRDIAKKVREILDLDQIRAIADVREALNIYIGKVESLGVAIFQLSITQDHIRGFAIVDDVIPMIGIKRGNESATSKIFTLFHELGHIILHENALSDPSQEATSTVEKWCNLFAAEVLIPTEELLRIATVKEHQKQQCYTWTKKELTQIGNHFNVSLLTVLRRLLDHGLTTKTFYQEKHLKWNKIAYSRAINPEGRNMAKEAIQEKGMTFVSLAFSAYDQNRIDLKDLSDFLGLKLSYIQKARNIINAS